jgi:hypothetical protein
MAKISGENACREVWFTLQMHFVPKSKPFCRPKDLIKFAQSVVGKP